MTTLTATPVTATAASVHRRLGSAMLLATLVTAAFLGSAGSGPMLVSRLGLRQDIAESIARAVANLGSVPWWALVIIGGGIAGVLVRLVVRYGWRYAANY